MRPSLPRSFLIGVLLACAGCESPFGSGPITLSPDAKAAFDKYVRQPNPGAFAVSPDGQAFNWYYCDGGGVACSNVTGHAAINACNEYNHRQDCRLYAMGRQIVWSDGGQ